MPKDKYASQKEQIQLRCGHTITRWKNPRKKTPFYKCDTCGKKTRAVSGE